MTRESMNYHLQTMPGIGVITLTAEGNEICYFYEDFDGSASGIQRAMSQLYPLQDKGKIKRICFVEQFRR